jgi:hypothetical protein
MNILSSQIIGTVTIPFTQRLGKGIEQSEVVILANCLFFLILDLLQGFGPISQPRIDS